MGWQDDPVAGASPGWQADPVVGAPAQSSFWKEAGKGLLQGGSDILQGAANAITLPLDWGIGVGNLISGHQLPTTAQLRGEYFNRIIPPNTTPLGQTASAINRGVGGVAGSLLGGGLASASGSPVQAAVGQEMTKLPLSQFASGAGSAAASDVTRQLGGGPIAQGVAGMVGGGLAGGAVGHFEGKAPAPPTADALKTQARALYKAADESGVVVPSAQLKPLGDDMRAAVEKLGYDRELNPEIASALRRVSEDTTQAMPLSKLEILRRVIKQAAESDKPSTQNLAYTLIGKLDDFVSALPGDTLSAARSNWARASKAEDVAQLMANASMRGRRNISLTGYEQALRTEFGKVALHPSRLRLYSPEEQQAIVKVATGGSSVSPTNLLRYLGKLAPTNAVSGSAGVGLGYLFGGPAGAVALPTIGAAARLGATALNARAANQAYQLMLAGGPLPAGAGVLAPSLLGATMGATQAQNGLPELEIARRNSLPTP